MNEKKIKHALLSVGLFLSLLAMGLASTKPRARMIATLVVLAICFVAIGSQAMEKWDLGWWY